MKFSIESQQIFLSIYQSSSANSMNRYKRLSSLSNPPVYKPVLSGAIVWAGYANGAQFRGRATPAIFQRQISIGGLAACIVPGHSAGPTAAQSIP